MFTEKDLTQLNEKGIRIPQVEKQIEKFENGFNYIKLSAASRIPDGILKFEEEQIHDLVSYYNDHAGKYKVVKFVPASGAASRMFKLLFSCVEGLENGSLTVSDIDGEMQFNGLGYFFSNLDKFAFYGDLKKAADEKGESLTNLLHDKKYSVILHLLLDDTGLGYGKLPKALLRFHNYEHGARYAIEEHLVEGVKYAQDEESNVYLHFTVSPEHIMLVSEIIESLLPKYEERFQVRYDIEYSIQKPETDTLAVDMENAPFRTDDGELLFRPAGHGALIQNMNDLNFDIAFVKNIDNIVPDHLREPTYQYKKVIGGLLLKRVNEIKAFLQKLEVNDYNEEWLDTIVIPFLQNELMIHIPSHSTSWDANKKAEYVVNKLNRPVRVCGMVKNLGEPGGGPFLVDSFGDLSLQIVEKAQVDLEDPMQEEILHNATHFNPVDLVCSLKDYQGNAFDLNSYVDEETSFISEKSLYGRKLKALELPGLWNGAMADWITIFVEVPIETFNPVKVVNDLLREQHQ